MYPVLHKAGFANQATATRRDDGLELRDAYITAVARCAPPANKPTPEELRNCSAFLDRELDGMAQVKVVIVLGKIAFDGYLAHLKRRGVVESSAAYKFRHGAKYKLPNGRALIASYHPSQQNTNTGKLTSEMFSKIFRDAKRVVGRN
jgi:uracil-DNA glycosylase family 4